MAELGRKNVATVKCTWPENGRIRSKNVATVRCTWPENGRIRSKNVATVRCTWPENGRIRSKNVATVRCIIHICCVWRFLHPSLFSKFTKPYAKRIV